MSSDRKSRNGKISILKFLFSILIIAYHLVDYFNNGQIMFPLGYIGVEFFFIVSGFYFCKKSLNYKKVDSKVIGEETFRFILKKIKQFAPYILFLCVISIPVSIFIDKLQIFDINSAISNLFYIPNHDNKVLVIYGITWYICSMIIVQAILFPILLKYRRNYTNVYSFLIVYFLFSYLIINTGEIGNPWVYMPFCLKGILRAMLDMNIGICIYTIIEKIKKIEFTDFSKFLLTTIELLGYGLIFYLATKQSIKYEFIMLLVLSFCLLISLSEKVYLQEISNNKLFYYLEKLSLPMYINQFVIINVYCYVINKFKLSINYILSIIIVSIISIIFAFITVKIISMIKKNKTIKGIFIN